MNRRDFLTALGAAAALPWWAQAARGGTVGQQGTQMKTDLSGKWLFSRDDANSGLTERWYAGRLNTRGDGPMEVTLPGTTDEARAGIPNPRKPSLDGLYRPNVYTGPAWYQREIEIPESWKGKSISLFLERSHWETHVWLDGKDFGTRDNLVSPQIYDFGTRVSTGKHRLTICVDNTLKFDLGPFPSIHYEGTQTNWNGIVGAIELRADDLVSLSSVQVYPDIDRKLIRVKAFINNLTGSPVNGDIGLSVTDEAGVTVGKPLAAPFSTAANESFVEAEVSMGESPKLWDEFSPNLYMLKTTLSTKDSEYHGEKSVTFGMRKLGIQGTVFTMNGRSLMLRGTLECGIFPLTGYPPMDVASWRRIYRIIKSYGLNFIRFHSWTPPDAAFSAADEEGIMIHTEGPQANVQVGMNPEADAFMEQELMGIIRTYGNHPSFCLMTPGNEFGGNNELLTRWLDMLIQSDPRHFYSSASAGQTTANRQWSTSGTGRGIHGPNTMSDVLMSISEQDLPRPVLGHEIGQWTFFPNFNEIGKYTGVLKAKNFELIRDSLQAHGMLDEAQSFFQATGQQAVMLYKEEIENMLRTPGYAGFSLLDLHDYPGQGTALVGLLDPFWDSKGVITPEEHNRYCGATVPLLRFPKRTYTNAEEFFARFQLSHFGPSDLRGVRPEWTIRGQNGEVIAEGSLATTSIATGRLTDLGDINASFANASVPGKYTVTAALRNTSYFNTWDIWIYPPCAPAAIPDDVTVSQRWDEATRAALAAGKRVVLLPAFNTLSSTQCFRASFLPVFWSPVWFSGGINTMSILCDPGHPLFSLFPTDRYSNWQWWNLIQGSRTIILNDTPDGFRPIVQVIDNFARNWKLGNVFEARVGKGSLLVCAVNIKDENLPEKASFLRSVYAYAGSDSFKPSMELDLPVLDKMLSKDPLTE